MPEAVLGIFGSDFTSGATALTILAFASLTNAATGTSGAILDMTGHTSVKLVNSTLSVGLAIILNLLLIPPMGVTGAAIASLGSVATVNLLRVGEVAWLVHVGPYDRSWVKPVIAGLASAAVGWALLLGLQHVTGLLIRSVVAALALAVTYIVVLLVLGLSDDDRTIVSRAARKFTRRRGGPPGLAQASASREPT
jgi:O-antigen/teichoic acid export membrane protein